MKSRDFITPFPPKSRDFKIYDSNKDEKVTSKYNFALS